VWLIRKTWEQSTRHMGKQGITWQTGTWNKTQNPSLTVFVCIKNFKLIPLQNSIYIKQSLHIWMLKCSCFFNYKEKVSSTLQGTNSFIYLILKTSSSLLHDFCLWRITHILIFKHTTKSFCSTGFTMCPSECWAWHASVSSDFTWFLFSSSLIQRVLNRSH